MDWHWAAQWREERGGWWRLPLTLALYGIGTVLGIALYTLANTRGLKDALKDQPSYIQDIPTLLATILIAGLGLIGCLVGIRFVHGKPIAAVVTDRRPFELRLAVQSAGIWTLLWLGFTLPLPGAWAGLVQRTGEIPLAWWPVVLLPAMAAMFVGRATEEVVFRGYLQTRVAAWVKRPWLAILIVAFSFTAMHRGNLAAYTAIALFGIGWGLAGVRAGTLAPMIGAHVAHDTLNILLQPANPNANASTTWLEAGLIGIGLLVWLAWLFRATRPTGPARPPGSPSVSSAGARPAPAHRAVEDRNCP